jgi:nucleotide-binding universal stress UspA family protein
MLIFHTILHPTDFSEAAEFAFQLAATLARDHGARLVVLHVNTSLAERESLEARAEERLHENRLREELHRLEALDPHFRNLDTQTRIVDGDPATEILRVAESTGCDLIVMGTHGRTGLSRLLMGSVAEQVSRRSACPVLTVKAARPRTAVAAPASIEEGMPRA